MGKRVTINTKITEEENDKLNRLVSAENISVAALLRLLVTELIDGDIKLEKGEIKSCPTPDEMGLSEISNEDFEENLRYKELRFDRLVRAFEENGYPENVIRQQIENLIIQVRDGGKYNRRRAWDSDCGC